MANKSLVLYFSWGGKTRTIAEKIAKMANADIIEITPEKAYPSDYTACVQQAREETKSNHRPKINPVGNIQQYDKIFLGTPNWCSTIAPPIATFLSENDFGRALVLPFVTHGGGGISKIENTIKTILPNGNFAKSLVIYEPDINNSDDAIRNWLKDNGF